MNLDLSQTLGKEATLKMFIKSLGFVVLFLSEGKKKRGRSTSFASHKEQLLAGFMSCWARSHAVLLKFSPLR